jgi:hypothetical protein
MFYRVLQVVGGLGAGACLVLALQATPLAGDGWNRARMLYAGAGLIPALALVAIGEIGIAILRIRDALRRIEKRLEH